MKKLFFLFLVLFGTFFIFDAKADYNSELRVFIDNMAVQAKWIDLKELYNMIENGEISWVLISRIEEYVIPLMKETDN